MRSTTYICTYTMYLFSIILEFLSRRLICFICVYSVVGFGYFFIVIYYFISFSICVLKGQIVLTILFTNITTYYITIRRHNCIAYTSTGLRNVVQDIEIE